MSQACDRPENLWYPKQIPPSGSSGNIAGPFFVPLSSARWWPHPSCPGPRSIGPSWLTSGLRPRFLSKAARSSFSVSGFLSSSASTRLVAWKGNPCFGYLTSTTFQAEIPDTDEEQEGEYFSEEEEGEVQPVPSAEIEAMRTQSKEEMTDEELIRLWRKQHRPKYGQRARAKPMLTRKDGSQFECGCDIDLQFQRFVQRFAIFQLIAFEMEDNIYAICVNWTFSSKAVSLSFRLEILFGEKGDLFVGIPSRRYLFDLLHVIAFHR